MTSPRRRARGASTYTHWHELMASPTMPMPEAKRLHQLSRMWQGLRALEQDARPTPDDWRVVSDAVNLLETLVTMGEVQDATGLLHDAVRELAIAGARHLQEGKPIRLDGAGIFTIRSVLEDYAGALAALPERTMVRAHRLTEKRISEILAGKRQPHDVEVMVL
ncbi:MAG: hypothetical protein WBC18_08015 [Ottowia sp.]|uniref:hypothetical protein n=1 Tax=Ottowia sp. TaxID=1898956 RepID=UPI003C73401F